MPALKDLEGQRFGRWLVTNRSLIRGNSGQTLWSCKCDCGIMRDVQSLSLLSGASQSCGCFNLEIRTTHGMVNTPEYRAWTSMKSRCSNKTVENYLDYGGRGISVCNRWLDSFENFFADMGFRPSADHSLERENVNGNYEPNNCVWATWDIQANNRRSNVLIKTINGYITQSKAAKSVGMSKQLFRLRSAAGMSVEEMEMAPANSYQHRTFEFNGESGNLTFWAKRTGISRDTLHYRLNVANWPIEKAFGTLTAKV